MEKYDYYEAVKSDIRDYIESEIDFSEFESIDELQEHLNDTLRVCDSVTGNASGSYTFNAWYAEEYLCHNWDLLAEAMNEFGCSDDCIERGAEYCDVTIRCYILGSCIDEVLEEYADRFDN